MLFPCYSAHAHVKGGGEGGGECCSNKIAVYSIISIITFGYHKHVCAYETYINCGNGRSTEAPNLKLVWKRKVKWSLYRSGVAQRVGRGIALLFHDRGTRRGWVVSSTLRPHFTLKKDPVPILQEAGLAPGTVWTGGKSRPHRDSIQDRPGRSSVAISTELPAPPSSRCTGYKIIYGYKLSRLSSFLVPTSLPTFEFQEWRIALAPDRNDTHAYTNN